MDQRPNDRDMPGSSSRREMPEATWGVAPMLLGLAALLIVGWLLISLGNEDDRVNTTQNTTTNAPTTTAPANRPAPATPAPATKP
jgi:hypothetical protein